MFYDNGKIHNYSFNQFFRSLNSIVPPFEKELFCLLIVCSLCDLSICNLRI